MILHKHFKGPWDSPPEVFIWTSDNPSWQLLVALTG